LIPSEIAHSSLNTLDNINMSMLEHQRKRQQQSSSITISHILKLANCTLNVQQQKNTKQKATQNIKNFLREASMKHAVTTAKYWNTDCRIG
jgi:hypothetical protein